VRVCVAVPPSAVLVPALGGRFLAVVASPTQRSGVSFPYSLCPFPVVWPDDFIVFSYFCPLSRQPLLPGSTVNGSPAESISWFNRLPNQQPARPACPLTEDPRPPGFRGAAPDAQWGAGLCRKRLPDRGAPVPVLCLVVCLPPHDPQRQFLGEKLPQHPLSTFTGTGQPKQFLTDFF